MRTFLSHLREKLRGSFWFIPGMCGVLSVAFAQGLLHVDADIRNEIVTSLPYLSSSSAEGVRSVLSTIGTSMLTLAGLTFSATLVALTLTSGQLGPRLLRNFIRSRLNQLTLGVLLGTFIYSLIVLRRVSDDFIPHLSAFGGFLLALTGLCTFIVFVHSLVTSMQAEEIVASVYGDLEKALEKTFPEALPSDREEREAEKESDGWEDFESEYCIDSIRAGYLQAIDLPSLVRLGEEFNLRFRVVKRPGQFIQTGTILVALSDQPDLDDDSIQRIENCFLIGRVRTAEQDFEYSIRQLVEVALRALSPGINDPFTAITCIDFLSESMAKIAKRKLPQRVFRDEQGKARVMTRPASFRNTLDTAFIQIRQAGADKPDVIISMLEGFEGMAQSALTSEQRQAIQEQARIAAEDGLRHTSAEFDQECIEARLRDVLDSCDCEPSADAEDDLRRD
ncbi:MAG: DUF2254 domain-containing protein [Verrucomicrobiales bacterium]|nr:DUF2254 domain-containing protein [Verrucomicrobiales bacterium]